MSRNLVLCLDGTRNEPETGSTNVARLYDLAVKDDAQLVYYDPGVGTMGDRSATTRLGRDLTRVGGLVVGHGVRENIEDAYLFLMRTYQPGDRLFLVGFSRGAYTARALAGMLRTVGLLRPGADNLLPYATKLYATGGRADPDEAERRAFWETRADFTRRFGNPAFPDASSPQVEFLGVWDSVKSVGWLNARARFEQARWPFTRKVPNVRRVRHALALDEWRRPYAEYRFDPRALAEPGGRVREVWFAGVHSDVGGQFPDDHRLSDIALQWMVDEAAQAGLRIDAGTHRRLLAVAPGEPLPDGHATGRVHPIGAGWAVAGLGRHRRVVRDDDEVHASVRRRVAATRDHGHPYRPRIPDVPASAAEAVGTPG